MMDKKHISWPSWTVVVSLIVALLCLGEFIRVELILKEHVTRIQDLESRVTNRPQGEDRTNQPQNTYSGQTVRLRKRIRRQNDVLKNASSSAATIDLERFQKLASRFCIVTRIDRKCRSGPPGPPGRPGQRGRRGKRGPKGDMGMTGRHGKQGMVGPRGPKGDNGDKGHEGPRGMPGLKGDPGQSISSPKVVISPPSLVINEGRKAVLHCSSSGYPKPVIGWSKVGGSSANSSSVLTNSDKLVISNVSFSDSGVYQCHARNHFGTSQQIVRLTVNSMDCSEIYKSGENRNGVYRVDPDGRGPFQVYCDMTTDGGGWTVFQRRQDGSVDFYRNWNQYKTGFGNLTGEFWLGNEKIHRLTSRKASMLRVELEDWDGVKVYAKYGSFSVGSEGSKYRLSVGMFSGSTRDSLKDHNGMMFSTKDRDNDRSNTNCAARYTSAWWFDSCHYSNLNAEYLSKNSKPFYGIRWGGFRNKASLKFSEMKLKPATQL